MTPSVPVRDFSANVEENIVHAANVIGRSPIRQAIFKAIYHHKSKVKSVEDIRKRTGFTRMRILQEAGRLASKHIVEKAKKNGDTAYGKHDDIHAYKSQILSRANNRGLRNRTPTKRNLKATVTLPKSITIRAGRSKARVDQLTVDQIDSFKKVRKIRPHDVSERLSMSERRFKTGVQKILGEPGTFNDWPGEQSDLHARIRVNGRRLRASFAFKGPGQPGKLTIGKGGTHGNQILRLFKDPADVFIVQHWREIDADVVDLMQRLARDLSIRLDKKIYFGVMDGVDSGRLCAAYPARFKSKKGSTK